MVPPSGRRVAPTLIWALALIGLGVTAPAEAREPAVVRPASGVEITRDRYGEAHVRAESARRAAFGFAYAQMADQAEYVLGYLATANGRSAELTGPGCLPACFRQDQATHLLRVPEAAREGFPGLPEGTRGRLAAFARGINAYIADHPAAVPAWAQPVAGPDVLAGVQYPFALQNLADARETLAGVAAGSGDSIAAAAQLGEPPSASNMFAIAGSRTATGSPILQGNPHLPFEGASQWYAARLVYPGTRVQGATFRGQPGIAIGSNGRVAWSHTANHGTQNESDVYREQLVPGFPNNYRYGAENREMTVRRVPIGVRTASGLETITVTLRYTVHGPVISDPPAGVTGSQPPPDGDLAYSAAASQFEQVGLAGQLFAENDADSLAEFKRALARNAISGFNVIAADDSHIFYAGSSRSGILAPGLDGAGVLDGSDPGTAWQGILPFESLPQLTDPPTGYVQNANDAPWFSAPGLIEQADQPLYLRGGGDTPRSRRQHDLLGQLSGARLGDVGALGLDDYVQFAPGLVALLEQAAAGGDPRLRAASELLSGWDFRASIASDEYPLFATWVHGLDPGELGFRVVDTPPPGTTFSASALAEARRAMAVAFDGMTAAYGSIAVPYGNLHTISRGAFTAPVGGGEFDTPTLRMAHCKGEPGSTSPVYYRSCSVRGGSGFVFNVDLGSGRFTVLRPLADSDDPGSRFFERNARDYAADRYRSWPLYDAALRVRRRVEVDRRGRLRLRVRCRPRGIGRCRGRLEITLRGPGRAKAAGPATRARISLPRGPATLRPRLRPALRSTVASSDGLRAVARIAIDQYARGDRTRRRAELLLVGGP